MALLILDNHDSFTYNLVQMVEQCGLHDYEVIKTSRNDIDISRFDSLIISPGPGLPSEIPNLNAIISRTYRYCRILGICLGHQAIAEFFGARLTQMPVPAHGKASGITHYGDDPLFNGVPDFFTAGRYHSWLVEDETLPACLKVIARSETNEIMAIRQAQYEIVSVQFHPESVITEVGLQIMRNFCLPGNTGKQ